MRIENAYIKLEVQEKGGSMTSIYDKKRDAELLYQPLPDAWQGQDVFIFPFIARLIDQTYSYKGKIFTLKNHGLLRYMNAKLIQIDSYSLKATFHSNEVTFKNYPFDFEATLTYVLKENKLSLNYEIINLSKEDMPFMLGAHPAFKVSGKRNDTEFNMSGNQINFDGDKEKTVLLQEETFCFMNGLTSKIDSPISLSKGLFNLINTIIIDAKDITKVTLNKKDGSTIIVDIKEAPYLALWSDKQYGDYVCIEPWFGYPDTIDSDKDITRKPGINFLKANQKFNYTYTIEIK